MPALRCFFTAEGKIAELTAAYAQEFGVTPRFRADAHAGAVVISERGDAKRQIAYVSGTMNVAAARLCEDCKAAEKPLLISTELLRCAAVQFRVWGQWPSEYCPARTAVLGRDSCGPPQPASCESN